MAILLLGASGFIGYQVRQFLEQMGYDVRLPSRQQIDFIKPNWQKNSNQQNLIKLLTGIEVVINMVGIMSNDTNKLELAHHYSPLWLAKFAKNMGVKRWINLSALGAISEHNVAFLASKGRGDKALLQLANTNFNVAIARPSLVFGHTDKQYGSSCALFIKLARLPILCLPNAGKFDIQPVHISDVAKGLINLATLKPFANDKSTNIINFTGKTIVTLADYLQAIRQIIHHKPPMPIINLPMAWAKMGISLIEPFNLFNGMLSQDNLMLLKNGSVADCQKFSQLLGHQPMGHQEFLNIT